MKLGLFHVHFFFKLPEKNIALESEEMQLPLLDYLNLFKSRNGTFLPVTPAYQKQDRSRERPEMPTSLL